MRTTDSDKRLVYEAYKAVKSNAGAAGVGERRYGWGATEVRLRCSFAYSNVCPRFAANILRT